MIVTLNSLYSWASFQAVAKQRKHRGMLLQNDLMEYRRENAVRQHIGREPKDTYTGEHYVYIDGKWYIVAELTDNGIIIDRTIGCDGYIGVRTITPQTFDIERFISRKGALTIASPLQTKIQIAPAYMLAFGGT